MLPAAHHHVVTVRRDLGGDLGAYDRRVGLYRRGRVSVRVVGECASACTLVTGVDWDRICVGVDAVMGFHQAYYASAEKPFDVENRSEEGTRLLMSRYPQSVRDWIDARGGLTSTLMYLRGPELRAMFRPCEEQ